MRGKFNSDLPNQNALILGEGNEGVERMLLALLRYGGPDIIGMHWCLGVYRHTSL